MPSTPTAARDIPRASLSRDNLTVVAARSVPGTVTRSSAPLLTPPCSVSPYLAPHGFKAQLRQQLTAAKLAIVDSDFDLHKNNNQPGAGRLHPQVTAPSEHESVGTITPTLLAKYHLPEILLSQGPLAIRHIMGYLATSVPGFAAIPPSKARRLVVASLERRGGDCSLSNNDVIFEKVGWGRWDARHPGHPARVRAPSPPDSAASSYSSGVMLLDLDISGLKPPGSIVFSTAGGSAADTDPGRMSLDGSASASCSEAPDDDVVMRDDPADATDVEDWAAVGAAALRAASYPNRHSQPSTFHQKPPPSHSIIPLSSNRPAYRHNFRFVSAETGMILSRQVTTNIDLSITTDEEEREAVEALLRLGAV